MAAPNERRDGLDSLRIIAILAVLFDHYVSLETFRPGTLSVRFFLFLSGFLITSTLQRYASTNWQDNRILLKSFYARRALRIWPLYYLLLFFALSVGWITLKQLAVHAAFLTNFVQSWRDNWNYPWSFSHVWTLCVQEQFYLVWPVLYLLLRSARWAFLVLMIVGAVLFQTGMSLVGYSDAVATFALPFASFDALAIGALAAMYHGQLNARIKYPGVLCAVLLAVCAVFAVFGGGILQRAVLPTLWLAPLGIFTLGVFHDRFGGPAMVLKWSPLVFLGRISLGIYLLHLPLWKAAMVWGGPLLPLVGKASLTAFAIMTPATLIAATISWLLLEKPLQRFRRFLPYPRAHPLGGAQKRSRAL